jgi:hypothetical protein
VTIVVQPLSPGMIANVATVTSSQPDRDPSNNTASTTTVVAGAFAPPTVCDLVRVAPRSLAIGHRATIRVSVRAGGNPLAGVVVRARGAGINASSRTGDDGVARIVVMGRRAGIVNVTVAGHSCRARFGVLGAFQPPLTG